MKVKVAETAGFCFGVKRAVNKVYELIDTEQKPIFTLGPIIHNEGVVADLEARGVHVITEADLDFPDDTLQNGTVVIRSHGVGKAIYDKLKEKNISYVDVTCPFVLKIHRIVEKESLAGNHIIIIGDKDHPEVQGICGWCQGPYTVIRNKEEAEVFVPPKGKKISIVSQTTFNYNKFKDLVEILCKKRYDNNVLNILNILNIFKEYKIDKDAQVLDLGCGTGKMARKLAREGYQVTAVDNSMDMLEIAASEEDDHILYVLQDMVSLELPQQVDAAVSICDCMNYILEEEDLKEAFRRVREFLKEDGKYYVVIRAVHGKQQYDKECFYRFGEELILAKHPVLLEYLDQEYVKYSKIKESLTDDSKEHIRRRKEEVEDLLGDIMEALCYYEL